MSDPAVLLQEIIAHPDDDGLRLAFADWHEHHGDPSRAKAIRVQCELFPLPAELPRRQELWLRWWTLHQTHGADWLRPFTDLGIERGQPNLYDDRVDFTFVRGFVEEITAHGGDHAGVVVRNAEALFALTPWRRLHLFGVRCVGFIGRVDEYESHPIARETLARLVALPQSARLETLHVTSQGMDESIGRLLLDAPYLSPRLDLEITGLFGPELEQQLKQRFEKFVVSNSLCAGILRN